MANSRSAEKRIRQTDNRRAHNRSYRSRMRGAVKQLRQAIADGDAEAARRLLPETLRTVDETVQKKLVHANAGARTKARLVKAVRGLGS